MLIISSDVRLCRDYPHCGYTWLSTITRQSTIKIKMREFYLFLRERRSNCISRNIDTDTTLPPLHLEELGEKIVVFILNNEGESLLVVAVTNLI